MPSEILRLSGLLLGLWLAVQERHLGHALERGGTLLVLIGLNAQPREVMERSGFLAHIETL